MVSALPKSHENILKSSQTAIDQSNCLPPALSTSNDDTLTVASIHARMRAIWSVTRNSPHLRHLTPYLLCQGVNFAYTFGNYPNFITYASMVSGAADTPVSTSIDGTVEIDADAAAGQEIAAGLLFYGIGSVVGSFLWGKIYDRWNGSLRPLLYAHALLVVLTFGVLLGTALAASLFGSASAGGLLPAVNSIGLAFGLIDALTNAVINNSVTANCEPAQVPLAFAWYRFCFCIGFAVAAAMSSVLPTVVAMASPLQMSVFERYGWLTMVVMNVGLMVASVHAGFRLEKCTAGKSRRRSNLMMPVH